MLTLMNAQRTPSEAALRKFITAAMIGLVVGLILLITAIGLDWGGYLGGFAIGVAIGLMLVGAYFWGFMNAVRQRPTRDAWRPSESGTF